MFNANVSIKRVEASCPPQTDPQVARLRLAHLLECSDLAPPGFPPQAILLVKRVAARERLSLTAICPTRIWESSTRDAIADLYRRAARLSRGKVPANAEAVLFTDLAELLACLGIDVADRAVEDSWYWRAALRSAAVSSPETLVQVWTGMRRFIPAAIVQLARWDRVSRVLRILGDRQAQALIGALEDEFGLALEKRLRTIVAGPQAAESRSHTRPPLINGNNRGPAETRGADRRKPASKRTTVRPGQPPWLRWFPEASTEWIELPRASQQLLALAVALFYSPATARTDKFATEIADWSVEATDYNPARPDDKLQAPSASPRDREAMAKRDSDAASVTTDSPHNSAGGSRKSLREDQRQVQWKRDHEAPDSRPAITVHDRGDDSDVSSSIVSDDQLPLSRRADFAQSRITPRPPVEALTPETEASAGIDEGRFRELQADDATGMPVPLRVELEACETRLGGVLYLINLLAHLDLPGCFDEQFKLSRHVSGWGLLEVIGRALLGPLSHSFDDDPIWLLLRALDGRADGEIVGRALRVGSTYRIPGRWLTLFSSGDEMVEARTISGRLIIWNPAGRYVVVERPIAGINRHRLARQEIERYRRVGVPVTLKPSGIARVRQGDSLLYRPGGWETTAHWRSLPRGLQNWAQWTLPFMRHALELALGEGPLDDVALAGLLLEKRGRIYPTATHVDFVASADQISLAVRRAGLDLNPGWLPELMRVVSFHYE